MVIIDAVAGSAATASATACSSGNCLTACIIPV
jgi:hypothetical protein